MVFSVDSPDWSLIYKSNDVFQVELLKNELDNQEINTVLVNRKDTMYPLFGQANLYVETRNADIARIIIENFLTQNDE